MFRENSYGKSVKGVFEGRCRTIDHKYCCYIFLVHRNAAREIQSTAIRLVHMFGVRIFLLLLDWGMRHVLRR